MPAIARAFPQTSSGRPEALNYHVIYSYILQHRFGHLVKTTFILLYLFFLAVRFRHGWIKAMLPFHALAMTFAVFCLFVVRKARLHVDIQCSPSLALQIWQRLCRRYFLAIVLVYCISSYIFVRFYCNEFSGLDIYLLKKELELARVNERRTVLYFLAFFDGSFIAVIHCLADFDLIRLPEVKTDPMTRVIAAITPSVLCAFLGSFFSLILGTISYWLLRTPIWRTWLGLRRWLASWSKNTDLYRSNIPGPFPFPVVHELLMSFMLFFIFFMANEMFSIYMSRGAIHRGKPISEKSSDPNGTLISGLKSYKRNFSRRTAYQELSYLARNSSKRRDSIYKDIEKPTIWSQICGECLNVILEMRKPFELENPNVANPLTSKTFAHITSSPTDGTIQKSPTIKTRRENIFVSSKGKLSASSIERKLVSSSQDPKAVQSSTVVGWFSELQATVYQGYEALCSYVVIFLSTGLGFPFRRTIQRKTMILAANKYMFFDAVEGLSQLVCFSITEDLYGTVQYDISRILTEYNNTLTIFELFMDSPPLDWTDVENKQYIVKGHNYDRLIPLPEVQDLYESVYLGLDRIVGTFKPHLAGMGLTADVLQRCRSMEDADD
ncbi:nucleoporin protein Ndc1-Nup [Lipomyces oligophaga]|uniref:nucleoporin protein Ndc1-Nup n=1 Tax=Lipomyces oligophaga TaxID=45792 RepID=UPI0034CD7FCE